MGGFKLLQLLLSLANADGLYDCIFRYILDNMALFFEFNVIKYYENTSLFKCAFNFAYDKCYKHS